MKIESRGFTWKIAIPLVVTLLVATLISYQQTVLYLTDKWANFAVGEYAHGFLVLAIAAYLIFINRHRIAVVAPCPDARILPLLLLSVCLWIASALVDVQVAQAIALWLVLFTLLWAMLGTKVALLLAFPFTYILFALPIWFPLSPILQDITADVVFYVIRYIGVPALRQENVIVLSSGSLAIEEACSGLRYLMAGLTLSTLYAYINYQGVMARATVIIVSAVAAILSNFVRVFIVVYLGYTSEMQHPLVYDHLMLGWYLFGGMVVALLFIDNQLARRLSLTGGPDLLPKNGSGEGTSCSKSFIAVAVVSVLCAVMLAAGPLLINYSNSSGNVATSQAGEVSGRPDLPTAIEGWGKIDAVDDWHPVFNGAQEAKYVYAKADKQVTLYVAYYKNQAQGKELINDLNAITNNKEWRTRYPRAHLLVHDESDVLEQLLVKNDKVKKLVWYQYNVAGKDTANLYEAKLLQVVGVLSGKPQAYVMAVATLVRNDDASAREVLAEFFSDVEMFLANDGRLIPVTD